ncbi:hypothetical protein FF38_13998 [Lucilia cuprina]|uniref:Kinesin motor domain-containing protein n=1 Tax=Lucilia cuprina TaxID=7375 RepID=A0A0L0CA31_LUCCU|nr:hypothetical protein FF38_13998 [Lucilia cuprina]
MLFLSNIVSVDKCSVSVTNPSDCTAPAKNFTFDSVYGELERTELLYNEACYSLVDNVLEGYNGTIFAYGQTGCGKTFTMQVNSRVFNLQTSNN